MATMALPMHQLGAVIDEAEKAQADTKRVVTASSSSDATKLTVFRIALTTIHLRRAFKKIVKDQREVLAKLVRTDFDRMPQNQKAMLELAEMIDSLVTHEREVLVDALHLSATIRVWWQSSLNCMMDQVEHFDSISESLHACCDPEVNALIAFAVEELPVALVS